ncbi:hypothetical protein AB6A40_000096 [Gnathostoma spinigerum]|uniref:WH2 domain-containing protein n=1 Tax=Gnathostoma spinigerum TaxID=75299 RepID=A0ABD6EA92_9BILA
MSSQPPPPPPLPPPPPSLLSGPSGGGNGLPPVSHDRAKLLNEIQKGKALRKTKTNDRSAPITGGHIQDEAIGPNMPLNNSSNTRNNIGAIAALGAGLFANGLPKKPSDNKIKLHPPLDVDSGRPILSNSGRPPKSTSPPCFESSSRTHGSKAYTVAETSNQKFGDGRQASSLKPALSSSKSSTPRSQSVKVSAMTERLEQRRGNAGRPQLAPPAPPPISMKPVIPDTPPVVKDMTARFQRSHTTEQGEVPNDAVNFSGTEVQEEKKSSFLSVADRRAVFAMASNNMNRPIRPVKPACPPPPPPTHRPKLQRNETTGVNSSSHLPPPIPPPPPQFPSPSITQSDSPVLDQNQDSTEPPPRPPPRSASSRVSFMDRFTFIPINELPPPQAFSRIKKVYEYHHRRKPQHSTMVQNNA